MWTDPAPLGELHDPAVRYLVKIVLSVVVIAEGPFGWLRPNALEQCAPEVAGGVTVRLQRIDDALTPPASAPAIVLENLASREDHQRRHLAPPRCLVLEAEHDRGRQLRTSERGLIVAKRPIAGKARQPRAGLPAPDDPEE